MRAHALALLTILVWGVTFVSTKVLLADFSPGWILLIRFALGFLALCAARRGGLRVASRRDEALIALAGLTGVAGYYLLENVALTLASATAVGVIVAASPLFTAVIARIRGDRGACSPRFVAGFALAMAGIVLVSVAGAGAQGPGRLDAGALAGCGLALAAAVTWALYSTIVARLAEAGYETVALTRRTFAWGLAFMAPVVLLGSPPPDPAAALEPVNAANLLFLGLIASAACFATWGYAVKHLGAVVTSTYIYLVPAVTAATAAAVLGEPLSVPVVLGTALAIAGLLLSQGRGRRRPRGEGAGGPGAGA